MTPDDLARAGLRVKPLEWHMAHASATSTGLSEVADPFPGVRYRPMFFILGSGSTRREAWMCFVGRPYADGVTLYLDGVCELPTLDAAKSAAQADYEARILAALEPAQDVAGLIPRAEAEAMVRAERGACAKEAAGSRGDFDHTEYHAGFNDACDRIEAAIRARGMAND
jgi:hypothetical protein